MSFTDDLLYMLEVELDDVEKDLAFAESLVQSQRDAFGQATRDALRNMADLRDTRLRLFANLQEMRVAYAVQDS
jgi:hypothetical protein